MSQVMKKKRGIRGGIGRVAQVKAAVTVDEKEVFEKLAKGRKDPCTVSHIIREQLIRLAIEAKLLPADYGLHH